MIELDRGIRVKGSELWLDSTRVKEHGFISHAHTDHIAPHRNILCSPATAKLFRRKMPKSKIITQPYFTPLEYSGLKLELHPAGHILGSAQILIKKSGRRIVYTGDFRLKDSLTVEPAQPIPCDILVMECTYGRPAYVFPSREKTIELMERFIEETVKRRMVPVFYAYALGKSQEALKILGDRGYRTCLHSQIYEMVKAYESLGVHFKNFELIEEKEGEDFFGKVLLIPPSQSRSKLIQQIPRKRTAFLSGWALAGNTQQRISSHKAIPFSDHADFEELLDYVRRAKPKKIYTVYGFHDLAACLRQEGFKAQHLEPNTQLSFWKN